MKSLLLVFLGGGIGSMLRYVLSKTLNDYFQHFFLGTFLVNSIGCLLIGFLMGLSLKENLISQNHTLLLVTGFCGGFTTFSTFAFEKHGLLRDGALWHFSFYTLCSLAVGVIAVTVGLWLARVL